MSRIRGYFCGTPENQCTGSHFDHSDKFRGPSKKIHSSRAEARRCHIRYLKENGYTQSPDNASEFIPEGGGPHLVITKVSRFGGELRAGKAGRLQHSNLKGTAT